MRTITKKELQEILGAHELWVWSGEQEGCRADLHKADLRVATAKDCQIYKTIFSSPKEKARLLMLGATDEED